MLNNHAFGIAMRPLYFAQLRTIDINVNQKRYYRRFQ